MDGLGCIFARNCSIRRITAPEAASFLSVNHRLGNCGGRYRYGLFITRSTGKGELALPPGTLAAVAVFSGARRWKKEEGIVSSFEWIRYASLEGLRVTGGMGKMLRHFIDELGPDDIMSYADLSWTDGGKSYLRLGFTEEGIVERPGFRCRKYRLKLSGRASGQTP